MKAPQDRAKWCACGCGDIRKPPFSPHGARGGLCGRSASGSRERGVCLTEYDGAVLSYRDGVITSVHVTFHTTRSDHITTIDLDLAHTEHTRHRSTANSASCVPTAEVRDGCVSHPH